MTLLEIKKKLSELQFSETVFDDLIEYNRKFQSRHYCSLMGLPTDEHKQVYMLMMQSFELTDKIKEAEKTEYQMKVIRDKIYYQVIDLLAFLEDRNLPDKGSDDIIPDLNKR